MKTYISLVLKFAQFGQSLLYSATQARTIYTMTKDTAKIWRLLSITTDRLRTEVNQNDPDLRRLVLFNNTLDTNMISFQKMSPEIELDDNPKVYMVQNEFDYHPITSNNSGNPDKFSGDCDSKNPDKEYDDSDSDDSDGYDIENPEDTADILMFPEDSDEFRRELRRRWIESYKRMRSGHD